MATFAEEWAVPDADDPSGTHTWVETGGSDWDIVSGEAELQTINSQGHMRCETDLDTDDHYAEFEAGAQPGLAGSFIYVWCRFDSASETGYVFAFSPNIGGDTGVIRLRRYNNGSNVNLLEQTGLALGLDEGDTMRLEVEGDASSTTLRAYVNDVEVATTTTTTSVITGNTRIGIGGFQNGADRVSLERVDFGDLGAPTTPVNKDLELDWAVLDAAGDAAELDWAVLNAVGDTVELDWPVAIPVGDPIELDWAVKAVAGDEAEFDWATRAAVGDATQLVWPIATVVGDESDLQWAVVTPIGEAVELDWLVASLAGDEADLQWATQAMVGDVVDIPWSVLAAVSDTVELDWTVAQSVGDATVLRWALAEATGDQVDFIWDVAATGTVGDVVDLRWAVRTSQGDAADLLWDVLDLATETVEFDWAVGVVSGDTLEAQWSITGLAGDEVDLLWDVLGEALGGGSVELATGAPRLVLVIRPSKLRLEQLDPRLTLRGQ